MAHLEVISLFVCLNAVKLLISSFELSREFEALDSFSSMRSFSRFNKRSCDSELSLALDSKLILDVKLLTVSSKFFFESFLCAGPRLILLTRVANLSAHVVSSYESLCGHAVTTYCKKSQGLLGSGKSDTLNQN